MSALGNSTRLPLSESGALERGDDAVGAVIVGDQIDLQAEPRQPRRRARSDGAQPGAGQRAHVARPAAAADP